MSDILTSMHGRLIGLDSNEHYLAKHYRAGFGYDQLETGSSPSRVVRFDDFTGGGQAFGTTIIDGWRSRVGTTNTVNWTSTADVNGKVVGTIGDTTASMAVSGVQFDSELCWKPNQGGLVLQARVKLSAITTITAFLGFTDQVAALEMPIQSAASANTITTNASDAIGFMFDTSMTTDEWWLVGVAANTDATHEVTGFAPVADTYETFRIEVTAAGAADFFRNGKRVGSRMAGAATATVALTPVIAGFNRTTSGTPTITADYVMVAGNRV
jgi:hypothetical protein